MLSLQALFDIRDRIQNCSPDLWTVQLHTVLEYQGQILSRAVDGGSQDPYSDWSFPAVLTRREDTLPIELSHDLPPLQIDAEDLTAIYNMIRWDAPLGYVFVLKSSETSAILGARPICQDADRTLWVACNGWINSMRYANDDQVCALERDGSIHTTVAQLQSTITHLTNTTWDAWAVAATLNKTINEVLDHQAVRLQSELEDCRERNLTAATNAAVNRIRDAQIDLDESNQYGTFLLGELDIQSLLCYQLLDMSRHELIQFAQERFESNLRFETELLELTELAETVPS